MRNINFNIICIWLLILVANTFLVKAQIPSDSIIDKNLDELFFNDSDWREEILLLYKKDNFIYTSLAWNSETYFSGRDLGIEQYNMPAGIAYYHKSGLSISYSGVYYQEFEPNWNLSAGSIAYQKTIDKNESVYIDLSLSQFFDHSGNSLYSNSFGLGGGYLSPKHKIGLYITNDLLVGKEDSSYQLTGKLYKIFTLKNTSTYRLYFKPQLKFIFSKQNFVYESIIDDTIVLNEVEIFDLLNTQVEIPLKMYINNFDIGVCYIHNFPHAVYNEPAINSKGLINLSIGYLLNL